MDEFIMISPNITKVYISMPMKGLSYKQIVNKCNEVLIDVGYDPKYCEVVNLLSKQESKHLYPIECFIESIKKLPESDIVIICNDNDARGVSLEQQICEKYNIPYIRYFSFYK